MKVKATIQTAIVMDPDELVTMKRLAEHASAIRANAKVDGQSSDDHHNTYLNFVKACDLANAVQENVYRTKAAGGIPLEINDGQH